MKVDVDKAHDKANWQTVIAPRDDIKLEGVDLFKDYLVYQERELGQSRLIVRHLSTGDEHTLSFNDSAYTIASYGNNDINSDKLRVYYTSMTTPVSSYDIDLKSGDKTLLKQQAVLGDFNADNYASERIFVWLVRRHHGPYFFKLTFKLIRPWLCVCYSACAWFANVRTPMV